MDVYIHTMGEECALVTEKHDGFLYFRCVKDTFDKQSKIKKKEHKFYLTEAEKHLGFATNK